MLRKLADLFVDAGFSWRAAKISYMRIDFCDTFAHEYMGCG
jgi:hypothetical protein